MRTGQKWQVFQKLQLQGFFSGLFLVLVLPVDEVQDAPKGVHMATNVDATAACFENLLNQSCLYALMCVFVAQLFVSDSL